jgi:tRNA (adenine57-N1/adenine58-N1)-methyltransferase
MADPSPIRRGDRILVLHPETGHRYLLVADGKGARKERGLGVVDPDRFVGQGYGTKLTLGAKEVVLLRPTLADYSATIARKAQIILPKDASRIVFELGVGPGDRVLESGIGSGAATVALAWAVGERGKVVVQELREDFRDWALDNLKRAGIDGRVEIHIGDLTAGLAPGVRGPFDAALLDQPEPWKALEHVTPELAPGATVACYNPQVSQMEESVRAMQRLGFVDVHALELSDRAWEVKERGSRPSHEGLGHTAFLAFGRWIGPAR